LAILALIFAFVFAVGCRREPEEIPDAQFSETTEGIIPVSVTGTPDKDFLQSAASPIVPASEPPAEEPPSEEPAAEPGETG
jgi:hypothetical protein